ncbi:MAG: hypothetical protein KGH94_00555 [Candidatus Micrarchaeota archaeon]|nr:hypothetical protein [Candidatus Micrarchaeota archaeon]
MEFDAWSVPRVKNRSYIRMRRTLGIDSFGFKLRGDPNFQKYNLIIGHEGFGQWVNLASRDAKVALVSGFMPSGIPHLGTLCILKQMAYYQKFYNAELFIPIADIEAMLVRGKSGKEIKKIIPKFIAHFMAAGIKIEKCQIYLQSRNGKTLRSALKLMSSFDMKKLEGLYGRRLTRGEAQSSFAMAADIIYPFGFGYKNILVTMGIDEISHAKLVLDLVRLNADTKKISFTYSNLLQGIHGSKMGKSLPQNSITLNDSAEKARRSMKRWHRTRGPSDDLELNMIRWFSTTDSIKGKKALDHSIATVTELLEAHQTRYAKALPYAKKVTDSLYSKDDSFYNRSFLNSRMFDTL